MKVARLYSYSDIRIEDEPVPVIGPREALVKTKACGICSGDTMKWYIEKKAPLVLGHEPSGEIIETGSEVSHFRPGDKVFVHHHAPCFLCHYCRRGDYVHCASWKASRIIPGGISEYLIIPELNLENDTLKLPDHVSFEAATLIEPTACVVKALKRARIRRGDTVLIIGLGVMGLLHILVAKKLGAGTVIGADMVEYRLNKAIETGADKVIDIRRVSLSEEVGRLTEGHMAQVVIVGPNSAEAMLQGLSSVSSGGTVLFFTPAKPGETITLDPNELYFRDINIVTSYSCGPTDTADALELIESGSIPCELLITHRFMVEDTSRAFALTAAARDSIKCVVLFD
jgi:L-iditol 2-dehydrogenase